MRKSRVKVRPGRRHRKKRQGLGRRAVLTNAAISDRVPYPAARSNLYPKVIPDDRRQWLPFPNVLPKTTAARIAAITSQEDSGRVRGQMPTNYQVRFVSPERVTVCIRRRRRREALFAGRKIGSGRPSPTRGKKPRRTRFSRVVCK